MLEISDDDIPRRIGETTLQSGRKVINESDLVRYKVIEEKEVDKKIYGRFGNMSKCELEAESKRNFLRTSWLPTDPYPKVGPRGNSCAKCSAQEMRRRLFCFENNLPLDPLILKRGNRVAQSESRGKSKKGYETAREYYVKSRKKQGKVLNLSHGNMGPNWGRSGSSTWYTFPNLGDPVRLQPK